MSILRHSVWAASAAVTLTASRFALAAILARRLSQDAFGQYAYAQWLVDISFLLCSLGATGAVSRYSAEYRHDPGFLAAFLSLWRPFALGLPVAAAATAALGAWFSGMQVQIEIFLLVAVWSLTSGWWAMQTAALIGLQRFDLIFLANVIAAVIVLVGALAFPLNANTPSAALLLMAAASLGGAVVGLQITTSAAHGEKAEIEPSFNRRIRAYALNIWVTGLLWSLVWSRGEIPIVRAYLGDAGVAQYAAALTLLGGAITGVMLGVSGLAPQVTRLWGEGRVADAVDLARKTMDVQLLFCVLAALGLIWLAPELVVLVFGGAFASAGTVLAILALALPAMSVSLHNHLLQVATDARYNLNATLLGFVVLMLAVALLVPAFGTQGAAAARAFALLVSALLSVGVSIHRWGVASVAARNMLIVAAACTLSATVAAHPAVASLGYRLCLFGATTLAMLLLFRDRAGKLVIRSLLSVVPIGFRALGYPLLRGRW